VLRSQTRALGLRHLDRLEGEAHAEFRHRRLAQHLERAAGERGDRVGDHVVEQLLPRRGREVGHRLDLQPALLEQHGGGAAERVARDNQAAARPPHPHQPGAQPLGIGIDERRDDRRGGERRDARPVVDAVLGGQHGAAGRERRQPVGDIGRVVDLRGQHGEPHRRKLAGFRRPLDLVLDRLAVDRHRDALQRGPSADDDVGAGRSEVGGQHAADRPRPDHRHPFAIKITPGTHGLHSGAWTARRLLPRPRCGRLPA
jgi:hypothetical protein